MITGIPSRYRSNPSGLYIVNYRGIIRLGVKTHIGNNEAKHMQLSDTKKDAGMISSVMSL